MKTALLLLFVAAIGHAQECSDDVLLQKDKKGPAVEFSHSVYYEWPSFDGWYNNPAHPEWGGADMPMERKAPPAYPDGVYEIAGQDRPNVLLISNLTQNGFTGRGSASRTAFFIFFGQQVVEEMLDAQSQGCIPEYENMKIPVCHTLYDPDCRGDRIIPFIRSRYDFRTGYAPNNPRMQLNEITPWMDGGLMYGPVKAWTDAIRNLNGVGAGELAAINIETGEPAGPDTPISLMAPSVNTIGLPFANPPSPLLNYLRPVNRFWTIGNPRGNENPFLNTMGVLWFRMHQYWARKLYLYACENSIDLHEWNDEFIFNRARQFTIATYQHIVYTEWFPMFLPGKLEQVNKEINEGFNLGIANLSSLPPYKYTPGYSLYFGRSGYNPAINPQIAHVFQSAAMRFGHTMVTPGIWRREQTGSSSSCIFGPTVGRNLTVDGNIVELENVFLGDNYDTVGESFTNVPSVFGLGDDPIQDPINNEYVEGVLNGTMAPNYASYTNDKKYYAIRTCNSYWLPQEYISETNVDAFYLGMASQATEREDFIITPDLRGKVFGPLDYTRRDLMAINMQRGRDHGLPDFNTARVAYGLEPIESFEGLNPMYGIDSAVTANIENARDVHNNNITKCDVWSCGLLETTELGPGTLFSEILYDQFMRIRHGDRFWYENYEENKLFTEEEYNSIANLTISKILVLISNIGEDDISPTPFSFNDDTVCPQPFQLSEFYMDDCAALNNRDYYEDIGSYWTFPLIWAIVFLYIAIVILVLFLMAAYNQSRRNAILSAGRSSRAKKIEGDDVTDVEGNVLAAWELRAGLNNETRLVSIKFGPGKKMTLYSGDTVLRQVDLRYQSQLAIQRPFDSNNFFVVKIPNEYDIIIRCNTPVDRTVFVEKLEGFLNDIGVGHVIEEPQKKVMLSTVYTKRDRQGLLENFFKSVFHEGSQVGAQGLIGETRKDILECELTRAEFADAMSLKENSLFIEQMFQLIDQDGNGFISFREFLDMIVIFSNGSPEDKLKLMFDMYDVDHSGHLDRGEFKKMLKAMMELVNASVSPDQMDNLINSMFTTAGFQNKQELTLEDFNVLLRDHKQELSNAHLKVSGFDVPEVEVPKKEGGGEEGGEAVPSRYRQRETAPARARRTIIRAYGRTTKGDPRSKGASTTLEASGPVADIPTTQRTYTKTKLGRYLAAYFRYTENYKLHIFYLSMFFLITAGIFVERAYYYSIEREHGGLRRIAGFGVTITRGAASGMMWTYSVLLLTMARNFITYLRETIFNYYVPFDAYISFHKIIAVTALFFTLMHCIGHGINFYHISTQTQGDLTCLFREVYRRSHYLPSFLYWLFLTMTGFSAFCVTLITIVMFVFATQYARRYTFQAFWFTHHWYVIFYILTFLHGSGRLVQDPLFGNFFLGPGIIFAIDQIISVSRKKAEISVVRADILPSQVIGIYFKRPSSFEYKAGQWVRISSGALNPGEFHPFTLSSAPNEENLSLHIRAVGPWTYNFRELYNPANLRGQPFPKIFLDGPYGEGHQDWNRFEVAILVGGGIGVTPFASILKELVHRFNIGARVQCKKVYFIWVTRTQHQFEWFTETIKEVEEADTKGLVEIHIFITQFFDKFDLRTTMLYICERHFQRLSGRSLFTGLRSVTHFGRPNFKAFFDNLQEEHLLLPKIGVFSCGPPGMTSGVEEACAATNRFEGPAFHHHYENF